MKMGKKFVIFYKKSISADFNVKFTIEATSLASFPSTLTMDPLESTTISIPDAITFVTAGTCKDSAH